jgi:hypothetical protein
MYWPDKISESGNNASFLLPLALQCRVLFLEKILLKLAGNAYDCKNGISFFCLFTKLNIHTKGDICI